MSKSKFLEEFKNSNSSFDNMVSRFMLFKNLNGNGVGAGKWFENLLEQFINKNVDGFFAYKLDLSNSDWCIHDIIVSNNKDILLDRGKRIVELKDDAQKRFQSIEDRMNCFMLSLNIEFGFCLGLSAKTYKEWDVQITTSNEPREFLDNNHEDVVNKRISIDSVLDLLSQKTNENSIILALNTFEETATYRLTNLDLNTLRGKVTSITFQQLKKHSRYFLIKENGDKVIDFKYGGKTANPYQRGMWICNKRGSENYNGLNEFETILSGSFKYEGDEKIWTDSLMNLFI